MAVLLGVHDAFSSHDPGPGHPEMPARLAAALEGVALADVEDATIRFSPRPATRDELELVHSANYIERLEEISGVGGWLDDETAVNPGSYEAATRAAGTGLDAIDRLRAGQGDAAFLLTRPPGHHAFTTRGSGFCLLNNAAIAAAALAASGERVLIVDFDAHHGNGTQDIFYESADVCYVSLHQYPFYPGTGAIDEIGVGEGRGTTVNLPFPAGTTGDAYRLAFDEVIAPTAESFSPSWLVVSAGFDAHRADPLTDMGLTAADLGDLTASLALLAPPGRRLLFLEGGYDLDALAHCVGATISALVDCTYRPEAASSAAEGGAAIAERAELVVATARSLRHQLANG